MSAISSIGSSDAQLQSQIGLKVAAKAQDVARQQGDAAVSLLEAAAQLQDSLGGGSAGPGLSHLGARIDVSG